jgi:hypothetical protein
VLSREELKRLERKARSLMLTKEIPQGKVDLVRSIMTNPKLLDEERHRSIIDLLSGFPDKPHGETLVSRKIDLNNARRPAQSVENNRSASAAPLLPVTSSVNIAELFRSYRSLGLFKKRILTASVNRFGIGFKKRLIPTKKCIRLFREIRAFQEKILSRLPAILEMILADPQTEEPLHFNYLRIFHKWMMEFPFVASTVDQVKWQDQRHFETEFRGWTSYYLSFREIDTSTREAIILAIETRLRDMEDLAKEQVLPFDDESVRSAKEKRNLEREKAIYEYMMIIRSYLPSIEQTEGLVSKHLAARFDLSSFEDLVLTVYSALIFQRSVVVPELTRFYNAHAPRVSSTEWDFSKDELRRHGKDSESKKRRYIEKLRAALAEYDDIFDMVNMRFDTMDFVKKAFDDQWKLINKRRHDGADTYERNFFSFVDECLNHFILSYLLFINGAKIPLVDQNKRMIESSVFSPGYFESDISTLLNLQSEIIQYKSTNPNYIITRVEAKRIMAGQLPSMFDIESFLRQVGSAFYTIGRTLQKALSSHNEWLHFQNDDNHHALRTPLEKPAHFADDKPENTPVPFYDCRLGPDENFNPVQKMLVGRQIVSDAVKDGILNSITAFCLQFAHECFDRSILNDLEFRKDLIRKIEEAERV